MLENLGSYGAIPYRDEGNIAQTEDKLRESMRGEYFELSDGDIFIIPTMSSSPVPLIDVSVASKYEKRSGFLDHRKVAVDFVGRLKQAGLKRVVFAGSNLGGSESAGLFSDVYESARFVTDKSLFSDDDAEFKWRLADYYEGKRRSDRIPQGWHHPLEIISPTGCVAEAIRTFAYCGISIGVTKATYPQRIPGMSFVRHGLFFKAVLKEPKNG